MQKISLVTLLVVSALLINVGDAKSLKMTSSIGTKDRSVKKSSRRGPIDEVSIKSIIAAGTSPAAAVGVSQSTLRGLACIIGGAMTHLTFGSLYCWGNFNSYAPSHLRSDLVFPLTMVAQCLTMPFGPLIVKKLGAQATLLLGAWIMAAGVFFSSYAQNSAAFIALYSIVFGAGVGIAYTAPMLAGWAWMPNSKGLVSGAVLTGFGAGGFFFNIIGSKIANPLSSDPVNGKFPAEVYEQFPVMLRKLAMIYVVLSSIGSLLISEPKKVVSTQAKAAVVPDVPGVSIGDALKTKQFWLMWSMIIASASAGLNVAAMYKQFASISPALKGDSYQSLVGAVGALFNAMGRLFWGALSDKIGFKNSFMILTVAQAAVQFLYPYSAVSKVSSFILLLRLVDY
jgi:MFS transporter, OFA family, oxalate/formate antiporter